MLPLTLSASGDRRLEVLCVGAHCDDIEIGCGGTVIALQRWYPGCRIHWLVMSSGPTRRKEALAALAGFVGNHARGQVRVLDLPDGRLPAHFAQVKACFEEVKAAVSPDVVFTHHGADRHQDHRVVSDVTWQTFRDHTICEYEIPKWDGDLVTPGLYVPLSAPTASRKLRLIMRAFRSQHGKTWFKPENLEAVMRLRGLESRAKSGLAEAFHCRKLVLGPAPTEQRGSSEGAMSATGADTTGKRVREKRSRGR